jgi:N-acetylmuramoyl-L-alanine amidase
MHRLVLLGAIVSTLFSLGVAAATPIPSDANLVGLTLLRAGARTVVRLQLNRRVAHTLFTLARPDRVVVDLHDTTSAIAVLPHGTGLVRDVRIADHGTTLRIVFDVRKAVSLRSYYGTRGPPNDHILIVVLAPRGRSSAIPRPVMVAQRLRQGSQPIVVCIDPGHGGIDSGAIGPNGLEEKVVTLAVGLMVRRDLDEVPGIRVVMTRTGDYYVSLRQRRRICQRAHGQLYVSIHANSYPERAISGAMVFALSRHGATSTLARWEARSENAQAAHAHEEVYSVNLRHRSPELRRVLLNLAQTATIHESLKLGGAIIRTLGRLVPMHDETVQQADFAVLRTPDIPSVLIETAFITNPVQARELTYPWFRARIAQGIASGILRYLRENRRTRLALLAAARMRGAIRYVVHPGDTLGGIALRYGVSVRRLRAANRLRSTAIEPGQVLTVPAASGGP